MYYNNRIRIKIKLIVKTTIKSVNKIIKFIYKKQYASFNFLIKLVILYITAFSLLSFLSCLDFLLSILLL